MMQFASLLWTVAAFVLAIGVLVTAHEYGHTLAARRLGVKVLRFSIGFGRPLWRHQGKDGMEWVIAAIPLGGYVRMCDEREGEVALADLPYAFNRQTLSRRALIVCAGPLANFILAVLLYWLTFMLGGVEMRPLLGAPVAGSLAQAAGIRQGDEVVSVNSDAVTGLTDLRWQITQSALSHSLVTLECADNLGRGAQREIRLNFANLPPLEDEAVDNDPFSAAGLRIYQPPLRAIIGAVQPDSPAAQSGLQAGDEITAVDGKAMDTWAAFANVIATAPGRTLHLSVRRSSGETFLSVTPRAVGDSGRGRIGVAAPDVRATHPELFRELRSGPLKALGQAWRQTSETSWLTLRMIGRMLIGASSWRNLSGPVTIADYAGRSAEKGLSSYLKFLALISISLGVLNLLPVPLLDGGHLLYYFAERVKGGPLSERALEVGQRIGISVLALLMIFAFYNDITRLFSG